MPRAPPDYGNEVSPPVGLHAHEILLEEARAMARKGADSTNEMHVWFVAEHLVDRPLVHGDAEPSGS